MALIVFLKQQQEKIFINDSNMVAWCITLTSMLFEKQPKQPGNESSSLFRLSSQVTSFMAFFICF